MMNTGNYSVTIPYIPMIQFCDEAATERTNMENIAIFRANNGYTISGSGEDFPYSVAESLEDAIKLALELCNFEDGEDAILAKLEAE